MECKIHDIEGIFHGQIVRNLGDMQHAIRIDDCEHRLRILSIDARGIEFVLDDVFHKARYLDAGTAEINMVIDGVPMTVNMHPGMDKIVYKNSGGGGTNGVQTALKIQIPGKVVSVDVEQGAQVKKGDVVCTLESMKMQVSIKAHRDGNVTSIRAKQGDSVAKNDVILEIE